MMSIRRATNLLCAAVAASSLVACAGDDPALGSAADELTFPAAALWIPLRQGGMSLGDVSTDGQNNGREIIGDATHPAIYIYDDGTTFFVRLRLSDTPLQAANNLRPYGWGLLIDSNNNLNNYEYALFVDGIRDMVLFEQNTVAGNVGDPADVAEVDLYTEPVNTGANGNTRVSGDGAGGFFLDWGVPLHAALPQRGIGDVIGLQDSIRIIGGTSSNGRSLSVDLAGCNDSTTTCTLSGGASDPITLTGDNPDPDRDGITNPTDRDDDNDGIPDALENGLRLDPDADHDGDGVPNWQDASDRGDGMPGACLDANANGVCDAPSALFDTDGDGVPNHRDLDTDDDGVPDVIEAGHDAIDANHDGMVDGPVGANGIPNVVETAVDSGVTNYPQLDTDGDGTPDFRDLDADGDGILDVVESGNGARDTNNDGRVDGGHGVDGDGLADTVDNDDNAFGWPGVTLAGLADADGDGIPNVFDPVTGAPGGMGGDSDGDGFTDAAECGAGGWVCTDTDHDGQPDYMEFAGLDADNDGVPNLIDTAPLNPVVCRDVDADGCDDCALTGANGSGGNPLNDGPDTDGDGVCNVSDADLDNDGVGNAADPDDGNPDVCGDTDGDTCDDCTVGTDNFGPLSDTFPANDGLDTDGDGQCDLGDPDLDNDGVANAGDSAPLDPHVCRDTDHDTCDDCVLTGADGSGGNPLDDGPDGDMDGICDAGESDLDNDGVPDAIDPVDDDPHVCGDTDGDTCDDCTIGTDGLGPLSDSLPGNDGPDGDGDGLCDAGDGDLDNDGVPNAGDSAPTDAHVCRDVDGDTCDDCAITGADGSGGDVGNDGLDTDGDGRCDLGDDDRDDDGVPNAGDSDPLNPTECRDVDGDTCDDCAITGADHSGGDVGNDGPDQDHDGTCDAGEGDLDGDGIRDPIDLDDDGDGILDTVELAGANDDPDGDGLTNDRDLDSDGDGIYDTDEARFGDLDADGDGEVDGAVGANGVADRLETAPDSGLIDAPVDDDLDGTPDYLDTDTDGDGISDADEAGDDDLTTPPVNTDAGLEHGDDVPDFRDPDSDADGILDEDEAGDADPATPPRDTDGDHIPDFQDPDDDNDGLPTRDEGVNDFDGDGLDDHLDPDRYGLQGGGCAVGGGAGGAGGAGGLAVVALGMALATRRRRRPTVAAAALAAAPIALAAAPAVAQTVETEYPVERLRLAANATGILDVDWAGVLPHLELDGALVLSFADDPLNLHRTSGGTDMRTEPVIDHRLGGELVAAIGLFDRAELRVSVPLVLSQGTGSASFMTDSLTSAGLGDLQVALKLQLLRQAQAGVDAALMVTSGFPTSTSADYFGDDRGMIEPGVALSRRLGGGLRASVNASYRARYSDAKALDLVVGDELAFGLGLGYRVTRRAELDGTLAVATDAAAPFDAFNSNYAEAKLGAAYDLPGPLLVFAGGGVGLAEGYGTPDWRALAGVRFEREPAEPKPVIEQVVIAPPADSDGDGLLDPDDRCPQQAENVNGFEDTDGCPDEWPDTDGDGLRDDVDRCVTEPEDADGFEDGDGCPDPDNDQDGFLDVDDRCPLEPGVAAMQGCPDPDRDGDTVVDRLDNCPDEPGEVQYQGCKAPQLVVITGDKLEILDKVYFKTDKAVIEGRSFKLLDNVAAVLESHPDIRVRVEGHTDDRGNDAYNKKLSQRRAEAVVTYLGIQGVDVARLEAVGYGEEKPVAENKTKVGRAANRRVVFAIIGDAEGIESKDSGPTGETIDR